MAETGTNIISSINKSGSGIDLGNLVGALVDAETSKAQSELDKNKEAANLQISSFGQLSTKLNTFDASLTTLENSNSRITSSKDDSVLSLTVTNETLAKDINANISVTSLAEGQVVTYDLTHSSLLNSNSLSSTSAINTGTINLAINGVTTAITIDSSNNTIQGLVNKVNSVSGMHASLIDASGNGGLSLVLKAETGTANAFTLTSGDSLSMFNTSNISSSGPIKRAVTAADAVFSVDGLSITRSTNIITDVFDGQSLELKKTSSSAVNVQSAVSETNAYGKMQQFIDSINSVKSYLTVETKRGLNGAEDGSLSGDIAARQILRELRQLSTEPIKGFGTSDYYLANLGVKTERDGTLSLDKAGFEKAIAADPNLINIVFASKYSSPSDKLAASTASLNFPPEPGSYTFSFTQSSGAGLLDSQGVTSVTNGSGNKVFTGTSGNTKNLSVEVLDASADITGTVRFGRSMIDRLQTYISDITSSSGLIKTRTNSLNEDLGKFDNEQLNLDARIEALTSQYNEKFGSMESLVTQLNKTGEYLTQMMDAWNKDD